MVTITSENTQKDMFSYVPVLLITKYMPHEHDEGSNFEVENRQKIFHIYKKKL